MSTEPRAVAGIVKRKASEKKLREIGTRLIWLRETMGQTQAGFARHLNMPVEMLNRWERGTRQPNIDMLCILCAQTEATLDFILDGRVGPAMNDELVRAWVGHRTTDATMVQALLEAIARSRAGFAATLEAGLLPDAQQPPSGSYPHTTTSSARPRGKPGSNRKT
jgi:transcriptional regulator with XRE-family HTH domain